MKPDRYAETFARLKRENRSAFVPFTVIGDPDVKTSLAVAKAFADGGADILELGLPFSDPVADGPVIQRAAERALCAGMNTTRAFDFVRKLRESVQLPIGFLCYYNSVLQYGIERFYQKAAWAGVDSVLVADAPLEESEALAEAAGAAGVKTVFLVTELSDDERIRRIAQKTTGFIYLVSRLGVTGASKELSKSVGALVGRVRCLSGKPVCVGFGVSTAAHVRELKKSGAEGIICGSALVKIIEANLSKRAGIPGHLKALVKTLRKGME